MIITILLHTVEEGIVSHIIGLALEAVHGINMVHESLSDIIL